MPRPPMTYRVQRGVFIIEQTPESRDENRPAAQIVHDYANRYNSYT
jgi:hypothetical protein